MGYNKNKIIVILLCVLQLIKLVIQFLQINLGLVVNNSLINEKYLLITKESINYSEDNIGYILVRIMCVVLLMLLIRSLDNFIATKDNIYMKNCFTLFDICFVLAILSIIMDTMINQIFSHYSINTIIDFSIYNILLYVSIILLSIFSINGIVLYTGKNKVKEIVSEYFRYLFGRRETKLGEM